MAEKLVKKKKIEDDMGQTAPDDTSSLSDIENESLPGERDTSLDDSSRLPEDPSPNNQLSENDANVASQPTQANFDDATSNQPEQKPSDDELSEKDLDQPDPEAQPQSRVQQYQNYLQQYRDLQNQRSKDDITAGLLAAGNKIGQSMAGRVSGQFKPDDTGVQMFQQMAARPVTDFEQAQIVQGRGLGLQQTMNSQDPASPQSKLVRDYLNQKMFKDNPLPNNVSASDAMMLIKSIGRPLQSRFQKVNGTWLNPATGKTESLSADFDPSSGQYIHPETHQPLPGFHAEGYNSQQLNVDPNTGQRNLIFNKSTGQFSLAPTPGGRSPVGQATTPQEVNAAVDPITRTFVNKEITPAFNKQTDKLQQRLTHVDPIMQRLQEAQTNAAALPQLKAELARFDVGDQRLAQQEFSMFGQRQGYNGVMDWLNAHTEGTISPDFAQSMGAAITNVSTSLRNELNQTAEKFAKQAASHLPPGQVVDPKLIAPLIYGDYKPSTTLQKQLPDGQIARKTQDGRIAIFDKNKKFLHYQDEEKSK